MKIVNRSQFLQLPPGTLYAPGQRWAFDGLCVKGETLPNNEDWSYRTLVWIDSEGDADQWQKLEQMLEKGTSEPLARYYNRDGSFDPQAIFLIYEPADLSALKAVIATATDLKP